MIPLEVKRMRISEKRPQVLALKCYSRAQTSGQGKYRGNNAIGERLSLVDSRWSLAKTGGVMAFDERLTAND
jgi:hypothetical protein